MTEKEVFEGIPEYHNEDGPSGRWRVVNEEGCWRHIDGCNLSRFKGKKVCVTIEEVSKEPKDSGAVMVTYRDGILNMGDHSVAIDRLADKVHEIERRFSHLGRPL